MKKMIFGLLLFWAMDLSAASYLILELPPPSLDSTTSTGALGISADGSYVAGYAGESRARHGVRWMLSKPPVHIIQIDDIGVLSPATTSIA